ncbi:MAG: EamA family transporter [Acidobacteria bacterium]|nr:EamA family transporter [Acidobacteriota bacterium]
MLYHVSQKAVPKNFNPFVAVLSAYLVGVVLCLIALRLDTSGPSLTASLKELNWAVILLGVAALTIEIGFLLAYRAGWNMGEASALSNVTVALALIPIGWLLFKEQLSLRGVIGVACCLLGLYLLAKR